MQTRSVAVFGLGSMGFGMARALLQVDHQVFGFDVVGARMTEFQALGGTVGALTDISPRLDAVVLAVLNAAQTETILFGDKTPGHDEASATQTLPLAETLRPGTVIIACATVPPSFARRLAEQCEHLGLHYLDAPMSGGAAKAASGQLSFMASGTPDAFAAARPFLECMAERVFELGDQAGAGSAMKAVNQMLAGTHIAAMAEAITFGMTQGVSPDRFLEVISQSAGTSWMLENRAPHIVAGDYTPHSSVDIWPKDLGIVLDMARDAKFSAPVTAAALQQFLAASGMGLGGEDDAAVAKVYARNAGITLPSKT